MVQFFWIALGGYLIGSISIGALIARYNGITITEKGSHSSGATNVGRFLGIEYFLLVFFLDVAKAYLYLAALLSYRNTDQAIICASIFLLLGNGFSIFLSGKGGKGVATSMGILLALVPHAIPLLYVVWISALVTTRTVGIASVVCFLALPGVLMWYTYPTYIIVLSLFMACFGVMRHAENIKRYFYKTIV